MFTPTSGTRINLVSSFASNYISKVLTELLPIGKINF